jgi:ABC-type branched-subunit amino acid transport system ATPase component
VGAGSADAVAAVFPELTRLAGRRVSSLSGGERQMVALARLLLRPGDAVLLDEATRGLAPGAVARLYAALTDLVSPQRTVVVVEQYQSEILRRADIVFVMSRGGVAWAGERSEVAGGRLPESWR